nr:hypothetical protein [Tanacetum cinerariifolium]
MDQRMNEVVQVAVQLQSVRLRDKAQKENDEFLRTVDENIKKIINEQALVDAYESDNIILDTYGETVTQKIRHDDDDEDKDEEPSARPDWGSKRRREEEPVQTTSQMEDPSHSEFETGANDQPIVQSSQHPEWFSQPKKPPSPDRDWNKTLPAGSCKSLIELEYHLEEVYKATTDQLDWFNPEGQQYPHNLLQPLPLIPNNRGRRVIPFAYFINNDLEYLRRGASRHKYTTSATKMKASDYWHIKWIEDLNHAVTELKIVEWHSYKHLDWITVRRDDDKLYKFKEGDLKRLRIQDIEDMLLLLVQRKLTNLTVEERFF